MENFNFSDKDIEKIAKVLDCEVVERIDCTRFLLVNKEEQRKLTLELYPNIEIGNAKGNLLTVYTGNTHVQLHFVNGYVASESLGEVLFVASRNNSVSGVVVAKEAACNIYSNVDNTILSANFTSLAPEVMIAGIALSIAESVIPHTADEK